MNYLPDDILREITATFTNEQERQHVAEKLYSLYHMSLNVGPEQLARCVLVMAGGNVEKLDALFASTFGGDPRDLIMAAMDKAGGGVHYGLATFKE